MEKKDTPKMGFGYLLGFAGKRKFLLYAGCTLSAIAMLLTFGPYICIWMAARNLISVVPNWTAAHVHYRGIRNIKRCRKRTHELLSTPLMEEPKNPDISADNSIVFNHVTFRYEGARNNALQDVSFEVKQGEIVALVGPSGGGKTTAASLVPRFWDTTSGTVKIGGVDVRKIDSKLLMASVAFVFQDMRLFKQSVYDNVAAARPNATHEEVMAALSAAQCDDILTKLPNGVNTVIGTKGAHLSGGEKQRIALARAFCKQAPIAILDEATASLDVENESQVQEALSNLLQGKTVLVIAHRMRTVMNADKNNSS